MAPATEPLVPGPLRSFDDEEQTPKVAAHREVVEVAPDASAERGVLNLDREVAVAPTPLVDGRDRPFEAQSVSPEPLAEHIEHSTRVVLPLEGDEEVIAVANQGRPSSQPRLHLLFEPEVEHVVQIDVPEKRREQSDTGYERVGRWGARIGRFSARTRRSLPRRSAPYRELSKILSTKEEEAEKILQTYEELREALGVLDELPDEDEISVNGDVRR